jgi:hypothetical protein
VLGADVLAAAQRFSDTGRFPTGLDTEGAFARFHAFYGHPEEMVSALKKEKVLPVATDLTTQFNPAIVKHEVAVRALELIATQIAPALGWRPAPKQPPTV